jgi:glycosyltransferase involved in cell wall biosynthesis
MRIDLVCNDGSPLGVRLPDVYGENGRIGVGGAELALLTMCEAWHNAGHSVRLYNNPSYHGSSPFTQLPMDLFLPQEDRDVVIAFRSPNHRIENAVGKKIWWSCDQYTQGNFKKFAPKVDKIVTISPFHAKYFKDTYEIENTITIDLPVRTQDYVEELPKVSHRMIYCSVPDRGLLILAQAYPRIKAKVPDVSLVITSDYRLWGVMEPRNDVYIRKFLSMENVRFMGAVPRMEMVREQMMAEIQSYPCTYDELFCYAVAECQVAGAYPVTSSQGSLATTNMGRQIGGDISDPRWHLTFAENVIEMLETDTSMMRLKLMEKAKDRFSLETIMKKWDGVLND